MITKKPTQKMKIFLLIVCGTIIMLETAADDIVGRCQRGDGVGGSEKKLSGSYSRQQCIEAVRSQFPYANGFTFGSWSSYGSCGTRCECYAEFNMIDWDNKRTWESCTFSNEPIIRGCIEDDLMTLLFPNPSYNGIFEISVSGNDIVLYNRHAVFEKGDKCIWFANDGYWHMGKCNNIGGKSVYILKTRDIPCPWDLYDDGWDGRNWFSGNKKLESWIIPLANGLTANSNNPKFNSATASVTYQVRDGQYVERCSWRKTCQGNWRCLNTRRRRCKN